VKKVGKKKNSNSACQTLGVKNRESHQEENMEKKITWFAKKGGCSPQGENPKEGKRASRIFPKRRQ